MTGLGSTYLLPEQPIETVEDYLAARRRCRPRRGSASRSGSRGRRAHRLGSARTRGSRVPRRREVGIGAHCGRRTPLRSRQRGRGRTRDVQGPDADAPRSVPSDRGPRDRRVHGRVRRGVLRDEAQVRAGGRPRSGARRSRWARSGCSATSRSRSSKDPTSTSSARRRRSSRSSRAAIRCRRCCLRTSGACSRRCSSGGRPTSAPAAQARATRPSSTTSRRSPPRRTSSRRARSGSDRWARQTLPARSS